MPELPEVETVMRAITPILSGHRIKTVRLTRSDLRWPLPENMAVHLTSQRCAKPRPDIVWIDTDDPWPEIKKEILKIKDAKA